MEGRLKRLERRVQSVRRNGSKAGRKERDELKAEPKEMENNVFFAVDVGFKCVCCLVNCTGKEGQSENKMV